MKVTDVRANGGYNITVTFEDGVSGAIDLKDLVQKSIFRLLEDETKFNKVYTDGTAIIWSDELEIDADAIYAEILDADPTKLLHTPSFHTAD